MKYLIFFFSLFLLGCSSGKWITNIQPEIKPGLTKVIVKNITADTIEVWTGEYVEQIAPGGKFKKWVPHDVPVSITNYGTFQGMYPRTIYDFTPSLKLLVMAKTLEQELKEAIGKLRKLPLEFKRKEKQKILRQAAKPLIAAAKANIPMSKKPHHRYATNKVSKKIRAPKGKGKKVATYYPGNARKSIKAMAFRRTSSIFAGPRLARRGKGSGTFGKGNRIDGYYANQLEFGNKNTAPLGFMRKAYAMTQNRVTRIIIDGVKDRVKKFEIKNRV